MANQLKTKFIGNDQVNSEKILLENNTPLRGKDSGGNEQDLLKIDGSDKVIVYRDTGPEEIAYSSVVETVSTDLENHIDNIAGAHAASAVSVTPNGNLGADDVQEALQELQGDIDGINTIIGGLSGDYVDVTGDTMTGDLTIQDKGLFIYSGFNPILSVSAEQQLQEINSYNPDDVNSSARMKINTGSMMPSEGRIETEYNWSPGNASNAEISAISHTDSGTVAFFTQSGASQFMDMYMVSTGPSHSLNIDINANSEYVFNSSELNMSQNELLNASKLEVKDDLNNVALDVKKQYLNYQNNDSNSLLFIDRENLFSHTSFIGSIDGVKNAGFTSIFQTGIFEGSTINASNSSLTVDSKVETTITSGSPQAKMLASNATESGSMTIVPASASVAVSNAMDSATYSFSPTTLDMDGNKIVDVQQLENLSAATMSGNAVRWDEVGQYDMTAGYGLATLGPDGKILAEQLPSAIMEYKGTWDASTNTPTLANGNPPNAPEDAGHLYKVSVGGTVNFGAGPITFNAGDQVILSAGLIWEKSTDANLVTSVNTYQGVVVLDADDLTYHQGNASDWTVADDSSIKLTLDEVGSRLTASESDIVDLQNEDLTFLKLDGTRIMQDTLQMGPYPVQIVDANSTNTVSLTSIQIDSNDLPNNESYYARFAKDMIDVSKYVISTSDEIYSLLYQDGKLSLTEGASMAPMVPTLPEHVIVKATLDSEITSVSNSISAVADDVSHLVTLSGMPVDSDNLGAFTGSVYSSTETVKSALQAIETAHDEVDENVNDLITLSGVAENSTDLGSFTGSTIPDSQTIKQALQSLETAHENHLNDTVDAHDASAIRVFPTVNTHSTVQAVLEDHEPRIDALEAIEWATPYKKTLNATDISNEYIDLPHLAVETNGMRVCVDRLALHQGAAEDYTVSVVGGVTRITFLNELVVPGQQQLSINDNIYVVYQISI